MNMRYQTKQLLLLIAIAFLVLFSGTAKAQAVKGTFLYSLSSFAGAIPYSWVELALDKEKNEVYVCNGWDGSVRIFNGNL
jgi:hypothetical protein